jgi:hypothetical protein
MAVMPKGLKKMRNGFSVHGHKVATQLADLLSQDLHDFCEFETIKEAQEYHGKETIFFSTHKWGVITNKK